jgi:hypothetical protein
MVSQVVAIFLLLLGREFEVLRLPGLATLWLVVALALVSGVDYFRLFWREVYRPGPRPLPREAEPPVVISARRGPRS